MLLLVTHLSWIISDKNEDHTIEQCSIINTRKKLIFYSCLRKAGTFRKKISCLFVFIIIK